MKMQPGDRATQDLERLRAVHDRIAAYDSKFLKSGEKKRLDREMFKLIAEKYKGADDLENIATRRALQMRSNRFSLVRLGGAVVDVAIDGLRLVGEIFKTIGALISRDGKNANLYERRLGEDGLQPNTEARPVLAMNGNGMSQAASNGMGADIKNKAQQNRRVSPQLYKQKGTPLNASQGGTQQQKGAAASVTKTAGQRNKGPRTRVAASAKKGFGVGR